jgi:hypothetical protein
MKLMVALAGWINQQQEDVIDYLREENGRCVSPAAWRIASLLPGCRVKSTIPVSGHYAIEAG